MQIFLKEIPVSVPAAEPLLKLPTLPKGDFYRFHTMVKPSGAQCNLDCTYCFYLHKEDLLHQSKSPRMRDSVLEAHIKQYISAQTGDEVVFTWQGGEPTLMGLDFFRRVVEIQKKYQKSGQRIENDLQTNGILLNDEWCIFLKQHRFLVGISIDGPRDIHDLYRTNKSGGPTFDRVMAGVELLHKHGVIFNALCVVNRVNARKPIDVYRFLKTEVRPRIIQFLPAIETKTFHHVAPGHWDEDQLPVVGSSGARPGTSESVVTDWSVDPDDWGYFLSRVWNDWFSRDFGRVFVDQFENVISQLTGRGAQKCVSAEFCGKALAIEHNGDLYSCDHFVYPEYRLGNILNTHEGDLAFSEQQKSFGMSKRDKLPEYCRQCSYLNLCWGECPKNRFLKTPSGEAGLNYLCSGLKQFYKTVYLSQAELNKKLKSAH